MVRLSILRTVFLSAYLSVPAHKIAKYFQVGCAGAVLAEVHRRRSASFLSDGGYMEIQFQVGRVTTFSVSNYMHIDAETLSSLQIVQSELHPNSQVWGLDPNGSGTKESLSVYGLFHHFSCTPQGRISLKKLFLRPTLDLSVIEERQRTIAVMLKPRNAEGLKLAAGALRKIGNIRAACTQLRKGVSTPSSGRSFDRSV